MRAANIPLGLLTLALAACASDTPTTPRPGAAAGQALTPVFPDVIALPTGFSPFGMAFGRGNTFYVGSLITGGIYRGDARTGAGALLVAAQNGRSLAGMKYDQRTDRLFVAGGLTGQAYVYDATTGATLGVYQLADPANVQAHLTLVNDVVVLDDAAYFTDSFQPVVYRLPLGKHGELPSPSAVSAITLTGDYSFLPGGFAAGFNAIGIDATPDQKQLILVNSHNEVLYRIDPLTGHATEIALSGGSLTTGCGIVLAGHTLYVINQSLSNIAVVDLSPDFGSGVIERVIADPNFDFPSAVVVKGSSLYVLNARFDVAPPLVPAPTVDFQVVRVPR
jgi:hypothetical protein